MSFQAYTTAAARSEAPRDTEFRLFAQVTRALVEASTSDPSDFKTRIEALDWNRRVWTALASDCSDPSNQMAKPLRASIISLSLFVNRHSSEVMRGAEDFSTLIDINRMVMQGLAGATAEAA